MPYIKQERRTDFDLLDTIHPKNPGELNYVITKLVIKYFEHNGANYQAINDVLGAAQGACLEFYRRKAAPYEDVKIQENGDVY